MGQSIEPDECILYVPEHSIEQRAVVFVFLDDRDEVILHNLRFAKLPTDVT